MRNTPVTRTEFDLLVKQIRSLNERALRQENQHEPTVPLYPVDFPDDPIPGQIALAPATAETFGAVRARHSVTTPQSVTANTLTSVTFDVTDYEYGDWFDIGVDNTLLTVPSDGFYSAVGTIRWASLAAGGTRRSIWINYNGSLEAGNEYTNIALNLTDMNVTFERQMVAGDELRLNGLQNSAGALDIVIASLTVTQVAKTPL